ncbi:MAG: DUF262 domain-containing protein [Gammaproteobacteria bacterium]|nr:DUF262 domain-containing protein [Gammaproteobacteria bacterium]
MKACPIQFQELLNGTCQYSIPIWQRRYSWGEKEIDQLISDIKLAARKGEIEKAYKHYCGAVITHTEVGPKGVVSLHSIIDGQQRLTTVTLLLFCIAQSLDENDELGEYTRSDIMGLITNPGKKFDLYHKLKLVEQDAVEYESLLRKMPSSNMFNESKKGRVSFAYNRLRGYVSSRSAANELVRGLKHLHIVHIVLTEHDDPQQVFESLNTTGKPLTEGEKIKNWLLSDIDSENQEEIYKDYWLPLEKSVESDVPNESTANIDMFFREFLRWKLGRAVRVNEVYLTFRNWALLNNRETDKHSLSEDLLCCARLFGFMLGTYEHSYFSVKVEQMIGRLRELTLDIHRPLTLRLLYDCVTGHAGDVQLYESLRLVETWLVRHWLSGRNYPGFNTIMAKLARTDYRGEEQNYVEFWARLIVKQPIGIVPDDEVREGIAKRPGYGGPNTKFTRAVFCSLMKQPTCPYPIPENWTIEHIMPQKLTQEWQEELGYEFDMIHRDYKHRLANLTLMQGTLLGNKSFEEKSSYYSSFDFWLTRELAEYHQWNQSSMDDRSMILADRILEEYPWKHGLPRRVDELFAVVKWRIDDGEWKFNRNVIDMFLGVVKELLNQNLDHLNVLLKLDRFRKFDDLPQAAHKSWKQIPNYPEYAVMYSDIKTNINDAKNFVNECGSRIEVVNFIEDFWTEFYRQTNGALGIPENYFSWIWKSTPLNEHGEQVMISLGTASSIKIDLFNGAAVSNSKLRARLISMASRIKHSVPADDLAAEDEKHSANYGHSKQMLYPLTLSDRDTWAEAIKWTESRHDLLVQIAREDV